jgi:hypothetical protein
MEISAEDLTPQDEVICRKAFAELVNNTLVDDPAATQRAPLTESNYNDDEAFMFALTAGRPRWHRLKSRFCVATVSHADIYTVRKCGTVTAENIDMVVRMEVIQSFLEQICGESDFDADIVKELLFMDYEAHRSTLGYFKMLVTQQKRKTTIVQKEHEVVMGRLFHALGAQSMEDTIPLGTFLWMAMKFFSSDEKDLRQECLKMGCSCSAVSYSLFLKLLPLLQSQQHSSQDDQILPERVYKMWLTLGGDESRSHVLNREVICSNAHNLGLMPDVVAYLQRHREVNDITYPMFYNVIHKGLLEPPEERPPTVVATKSTKSSDFLEVSSNGGANGGVTASSTQRKKITIVEPTSMAALTTRQQSSIIDDVSMAGGDQSSMRFNLSVKDIIKEAVAAAAAAKASEASDSHLKNTLSDIMSKHGRDVDQLRVSTESVKATPYMVHSRIFLRPLHSPDKRLPQRMRGWQGLLGTPTDVKPASPLDEEIFIRNYQIHKVCARTQYKSQYSQTKRPT